MRLLVTGSDTIPGRNILAALKAKGADCVGLDSEWPLQADAMAQVADIAPGLIINAHELADIALCEEDLPLCKFHNEEVVRRLAEYAGEHQVPMIQMSSCQVFDGHKMNPYKASNQPNPINNYGLSKWHAERHLCNCLPHSLVLRLGWLIEHGADSVLGQLIQAKKNGTIAYFSDEHRGNPTAGDDVARVVVAIIQQVLCDAQVWGTYHYASAEVVSRLAFARSAAELFMDAREVTELVLCASPEQVAQVPEPLNASLACIRIRNTFGIKQRPWRHYLPDIIEQSVKPQLTSWGGTPPSQMSISS